MVLDRKKGTTFALAGGKAKVWEQVKWETRKMGEFLIACIFSVKYQTRYSSGCKVRVGDVGGLRM